MNDLNALLRAIIVNPDCDTVRSCLPPVPRHRSADQEGCADEHDRVFVAVPVLHAL